MTLLRRPMLAGAAVASIILIACARSTTEWSEFAPPGLNLSGTWVLNPELSDSVGVPPGGGPLGEGLPGALPGPMSGSPPERGRPGTRGGVPGGGGQRPPRGDVDPERIRQLVEMARDPARRLTLRQTDSSFSVASEPGEVIRLPTNHKTITREWADGSRLNLRAGWQANELVLEREIEWGGKLTERYGLVPGANQLYVVTSLEIDRNDPFEVRFVYDPAPDA